MSSSRCCYKLLDSRFRFCPYCGKATDKTEKTIKDEKTETKVESIPLWFAILNVPDNLIPSEIGKYDPNLGYFTSEIKARFAIRNKLIKLGIAGWVKEAEDACDRDRIEFVGNYIPTIEDLTEDSEISDWKFKIHKHEFVKV